MFSEYRKIKEKHISLLVFVIRRPWALVRKMSLLSTNLSIFSFITLLFKQNVSSFPFLYILKLFYFNIYLWEKLVPLITRAYIKCSLKEPLSVMKASQLPFKVLRRRFYLLRHNISWKARNFERPEMISFHRWEVQLRECSKCLPFAVKIVSAMENGVCLVILKCMHISCLSKIMDFLSSPLPSI